MINSSQINTEAQLNVNQKFDKILISTPLQSKYHNNITFKNAQQNLMKQLETLIKTSFYKQFVVYLGAENLSNRSFIEEKYKRQEQILKLKIEETKNSIFQLSKTSDEQEFDNAMKTFKTNINIINQRSQEVDHVDFVPVIYVEATKKKPFYGHLMQEFNQKGAGMFNVKFGFRSPILKFDTLQFKIQTPINNLRRKYYNFDLQWRNPNQQHGNIFARLSHANQAIFKDIDEKSHCFNIGIDQAKQNFRIEWENKLRSPIINNKFDQYILKDYHLPSFKSSLKLSKVWQNSVQFNDINVGKYLETKAEFTIPYFSKSQFAKLQLNYRKFYDTIGLKKYFDSQLMKKVLYNSSFETNLSWNLLKTFSTKYVSDVSQNMEVRGFEQAKVPVPTFSNCKLSAKFNFHNYPLIGSAKITPFLYAQAGFSLLDFSNERRQPFQKIARLYSVSSIGMGVAFYVNTFAQIQLLYNLAGYQSLPRRQPTGFQIRIGVFD